MKYLKVLVMTMIIISCAGAEKVTKSQDKIVAPFDGKVFNNLEPFPDKNLFDLLRWQINAKFVRKSWPEIKNQKQYLPEVKRSESLKVSVVNHATVLIQMNGLNILTDPQFSERASPLSWVGPKRVIKPGISFNNLPPIDVVVVSHDHYDHLDIPTLKKISDKWNSQIYVGLGNKLLLHKNGIKNVIEMDWWQKNNFKNISIQFVPVQHWSARGLGDKRETLWGGFVIEGEKRVFFAGDTGYGKVFKKIYEKVGKMDLSLIPIGAYQPRYFMKNAHVWPAESVKIFKDTHSKYAIGIHFGTFAGLTDEYIDQPKIDLKKSLVEEKILDNQFIVPEFGRTYSY